MANPINLRLCSLIAGCLLWPCLAGVVQAAAEVDPAVQFARGVEAADAGRWADAETAFAAVCEVAPTGNALLNLATARYHQRKPLGALAALDALDGLPTASEQERAAGAKMRPRCEAMLGSLAVEVEPTAAELRLDGELLAADRGRLRVDPGVHTLHARAEGYADGQARVEVAAGERAQVPLSLSRLTLAPAAPAPSLKVEPAAPAPAVSEPAARVDDGKRRRRWLWAVGVVVLAGAAAAVAVTTAGGAGVRACSAGTVEGVGACAR